MRFPSPNDDLSRVWRLLIVRAGIVLVLSVAALPWPVISEASIYPMMKLLVAYALVWSALELAVGLHLRRRVLQDSHKGSPVPLPNGGW